MNKRFISFFAATLASLAAAVSPCRADEVVDGVRIVAVSVFDDGRTRIAIDKPFPVACKRSGSAAGVSQSVFEFGTDVPDDTVALALTAMISGKLVKLEYGTNAGSDNYCSFTFIRIH